MKIDDFSGGLNTRISPSLLAPNEAQTYVNIDNSSGSLKPILSPLSTGIVVSPYYTYFVADDTWVSKDIETFYTEYNDKLYISDGINNLKVLKDNIETDLGISAPTQNIEILSNISDSLTIELSTTGGNFSTGLFEYVVAIDSSVLNYTILSRTSYDIPINGSSTNSLSLKIGTIASDILVEGDILQVYRKYNGEYTLVSDTTYTEDMVIVDSVYTLDNITMDYSSETYTYCYTYYNSSNGDESATSKVSESTELSAFIMPLAKSEDVLVDTIRLYRIGGDLLYYTLVLELPNEASTDLIIDNETDVNLAGNHILDSQLNTKPIKGLNYIGEAYAMLFAFKADKLYYSEIGQPLAWPSVNFIDFPATITGWGSVPNGILVFTKYKTYIITGNSPASFSKYLLSGSQGCINQNTIQSMDNYLIWISTDGICVSSGGAIEVISKNKLGKLTFNKTFGSAVLDNVYYVSYDYVTGNRILAFDARYNQIIRDVYVTGNMLVTAMDNIYQEYNGTLQRLFATNNLSMSYKSPTYTEGSYSLFKRYKNIYIKYEGEIEFKVYINGDLSITIGLDPTKTFYDLKLPADKCGGYSIEFEVNGTGIVYEIDYIIYPRTKQ